MGSLWIQAYRLNPSKPSSQESRGFNHGSVNLPRVPRLYRTEENAAPLHSGLSVSCPKIPAERFLTDVFKVS